MLCHLSLTNPCFSIACGIYYTETRLKTRTSTKEKKNGSDRRLKNIGSIFSMYY
jgi:hypothetical protein